MWKNLPNFDLSQAAQGAVLRQQVTIMRYTVKLRNELMVTLHPNFLERDGKRAFVVLPYEEYLMLEEEMQSFEDLKALRAAKTEEADSPTASLSEVRNSLGL